MSNLKIIDKKIDELWHSGLIDNKKHMFFNNMETVKHYINSFRNSWESELKINSKKESNNKCNLKDVVYPKVHVLKDKKILNEKKLKKKEILHFLQILSKKHPRNFIEKEFKKIKNKILPSNINLKTFRIN